MLDHTFATLAYLQVLVVGMTLLSSTLEVKAVVTTNHWSTALARLTLNTALSSVCGALLDHHSSLPRIYET